MSDQEGPSSEKVSLLPVDPLEVVVRDGQVEEEEEEEIASSAHLEPSTLPWPGDKDLKLQVGADKALEHQDEDLADVQEPSDDEEEEEGEEGRAQKTRSRWRESMPEGEKWRDDEVEVQHEGSGSLADDEDDDEEEEDDEEEVKWISEKAARGFTPEVTIVRPSCKVQPEECQPFLQRDKALLGLDPASSFYGKYEEEDDKYCKYHMT